MSVHQRCPSCRCLLLGTNIAQGGAQSVLLNLAGWLHASGIAVQAAFLYDRDGLINEWQRAYGFPIVCMDAWQRGASPVRRLVMFLQGWFRLVRWMRRERFDALLTFTHDANIVGLPAAWLAGIRRRFGSDHNRYPSLTPARIRLHRWIINSRMSHGLVAVSKFTEAQALEEGIRSDRIHLIHNGVIPTSADPTLAQMLRIKLLGGSEGHIVLTVGRLVPQKAHHVLARAAQLVTKSLTGTRFVVAGEGPERSALQGLIVELGLSETMHLLGSRDDIPELMAASDLFVLSSSTEGLPVALLEALSAGLAVVSTRIDGVADVIFDGNTGLLVPVDDPQALADAICRILQDEPLRARLGSAGKTLVVKEFSLEKMGNHYLELFTGGTLTAS